MVGGSDTRRGGRKGRREDTRRLTPGATRGGDGVPRAAARGHLTLAGLRPVCATPLLVSSLRLSVSLPESLLVQLPVVINADVRYLLKHVRINGRDQGCEHEPECRENHD